jgi:DDB1- and CUL4-associated factor 8
MSYGSLVDAIVNRHRGNRFDEYQDIILGSEYLVKNFEKTQVLAGHNGCVNTVLFSEDGSLAITGSDDKTIKLFDICNGVEKNSISTVHDANTFFAKDRPLSQCNEILSCGADGKVVHIPDLARMTSQRVLFEHFGRAHRLAFMPNSADELYSCGEDGRVVHYDLRDRSTPSLRMRFMCREGIRRPIYAIGINPVRPYEVALGGDYQYVRIFDTRATVVTPVRELCPSRMRHSTNVSVTGLKYDHSGRELLISYNGPRQGDIFIMSADTAPLPRTPREEEENEGAEFEICHDSSYRGLKSPCHKNRMIFRGHSNVQTVKQVNYMGAHSEFVVSGSDCGHVFIWSSRSGSLLKVFLADREGAVNCLTPHPSLPLLATSGLSSEAMLWSPGERYEEVKGEEEESGTSPSGAQADSSIEAFVNRVLIPGGWRAQSDVTALRHMQMIGQLGLKEDELDFEELDLEEWKLRARVLRKANREVRVRLQIPGYGSSDESGSGADSESDGSDSDDNTDDDGDGDDDDDDDDDDDADGGDGDSHGDDDLFGSSDGSSSSGEDSEEVAGSGRPVGDLPLHRALLAFDRARVSVDTVDRQQEGAGRGRRRGRSKMEEGGGRGGGGEDGDSCEEEGRDIQGRVFQLVNVQDEAEEEEDGDSSSAEEEWHGEEDECLRSRPRYMGGGEEGGGSYDDGDGEDESSEEEEEDDEQDDDEHYDSSSTDDPYEAIVCDVDCDAYEDADKDISNREFGEFDNVD